MRGRQLKGKSSTDLLVCFPTRANLALLPKPICSPARLSLPEPNSGNSISNRSSRRMKKSPSAARRGQNGGPVLWANTTVKQAALEPAVSSEPTSPKVTCAGQIKVKPRIAGGGGVIQGRSWQSVMEEIEKRKRERPGRARQSSSSSSSSSSGFMTKEIVQFLACLRNVRFNFRCFGAFPADTGTLSNDDDDEDDDEEEGENGCTEEEEDEEWEDNPKPVFSNWFMVVKEKNDGKTIETHQEEAAKKQGGKSRDDGTLAVAEVVPPPNALLLMRCRSAPAKSWRLEAVKEDREEAEEGMDEVKKKLRLLMKEKKREDEEEEVERKKKKQQSILMEAYGVTNDHCKMSSEIAKETWVVGGGTTGEALLPRSWSCSKR
ncbi:hypothetical protein SAY86_022680 [Trapa natans]|uniref:Uncharacterized protein n=1 Tax=Trapa natans TaxID=22666 RepID=A0AAN7R8L3_TRANT|nr:hypothetical protein SAY86_022680 [Trapa natans]